MVGFIDRGTEYKDQQVMLQLCTTLEKCVQFQWPDNWKDVEALEWMQKRFITMLPGLQGISYMERLDKLVLFSLEWRSETPNRSIKHFERRK